MKEEVKILDGAIKDIENWKGHAYQPDDEVGLAVEDIKDVANRLRSSIEPQKDISYDINEMLNKVSIIESDEDLTNELRKSFATEFSMIKACIKGNLIKAEAIILIKEIVPTVYKIGDKLFLKGETKGEHDFVGDKLHHQPVTELFDMTTEMESGDSYSFYVSSTEYFELATPEEHIRVKKFLNNLYN
jgi:hypothetical protein